MPDGGKEQAAGETNKHLPADPERERLIRDIYRSDKEKFELLVAMFRRNALLKKAKITHKQ